MRKPYTVVLLRPEILSTHLATDPDTADIYVSMVKAFSPKDALIKARIEVAKADRKDISWAHYVPKPAEYKLCAVFEGTHTPVLWSFQN